VGRPIDSLDEQLRQLAHVSEVPLPESMAGAQERAENLLPAGAIAPDGSTLVSPPALDVARSVDELPEVPPEHFFVLAEHARGGMGRILLAQDRRLGRVVAIKELLRREHGLQRFVREVLVTARLQHPSIVPVHEAGRWPNGDPFYVMKLVQGRPLSELLEEGQTLDERMAFLPALLAAAEAVAYAHSRRIVHRDLKPANILVGDFGETMVVDWGLAKELTSAPSLRGEPTSGELAASLTTDGEVVGTPAFMAPEQATAHGVDERVDVYSLGAILYNTLAGALPYTGASSAEVLKSVIAGPPQPLAKRVAGAPVDLVAIAEKAMARDPAARYPTARELAADLKRFQTGQIVAAHRYSRVQRLRRAMRRHPVATVLAAAILGLLGTATAVRLAATGRIERERAEAVGQRGEAERARARESARVDELVLAYARAALPTDPTKVLAELKSLRLQPQNWAAARAVAAAAQVRGVAWRVLAEGDSPIDTLTFSPDGSRLATSTHDGRLRVWPLAGGAPIEWRGSPGSVSRLVSTDGSGELILIGREVRLWNPYHGEPRLLDGDVDAAVVSADRRLLVTAGRTLRRWRLPDGVEETATALPARLEEIALSPDGHTLVAQSSDGLVARRDGEARSHPLEGARCRQAAHLSFSGDGRRLAFACGEEVRLIALSGSGASSFKLGAKVHLVELSPDGSLLAAADESGVVQLWELAAGRSRQLSHAGDRANDLRFSPDGKRLASTRGTMVRVWDVPSGDLRKLRGHATELSRLAFSGDGTLLASGGFDGTARVWRVSEGEPELAHLPAGDGWTPVAMSASSQKVALASADGKLAVWQPGAPVRPLGQVKAPLRAVLAADGTQLAALDAGGAVHVWETLNGAVHELSESGIADVAFSADGHVLVTARSDGNLQLWRDFQKWRAGDAGVPLSRVAVSTDGNLAACGARDGSLRLFSAKSGEWRELARDYPVDHLAFSADDERLGGGRGRHVRVWQVMSSREIASLTEEETVDQLGFADADLIVVALHTGRLKMRDLASGDSWLLVSRGAPVAALTVSPTDSTIASTDAEGGVRFWRNPVPSDASAFKSWLERATTAPARFLP
jgi:WD40 repeat protein